MKNKYLALIQSTRFHQLAGAAILAGLEIYQQTGDIKQSIIKAAIGLLIAVVTVGTIDRHGEMSQPAAGTTTVSIPAEVSSVTASTDPA